MYNEILKCLQEQIEQQEWEKIKNKTYHLGVFIEPYLTYMLNGKKTIESRFSKNKIMPYNQIFKEDVVIVKKSSGNIVAYFTIKEVLFFNLNETSIEEIKAKYNKQLCVDENFYFSKRNCNYATLIVIDQIKKINPFPIKKKGMQTWVVLNKKEKIIEEE